MPVIGDLELPIQPEVITGPAVDALKNRKENNNRHRASAAEFRENYQRIKSDLFAGLKRLANK